MHAVRLSHKPCSHEKISISQIMPQHLINKKCVLLHKEVGDKGNRKIVPLKIMNFPCLSLSLFCNLKPLKLRVGGSCGDNFPPATPEFFFILFFLVFCLAFSLRQRYTLPSFFMKRHCYAEQNVLVLTTICI